VSNDYDETIDYNLSERDYSLLISAGFRSQGLYWDLMWASDTQGNIWQASLDEHELVQFYAHGQDMKRESSRCMLRSEFCQLFGV